MTIREYVGNGIIVIEPAGQLIAETAGGFSHVVAGRLDRGWDKLIVDLHKVTWIDSAGVGALVHASMSAARHGARLVLVHVTSRNHPLLITKLATLFEICETTAAAERSLSGTAHRSMAHSGAASAARH